MFREVGNLYARAFRMIFQYPIFIYLSALYYLYRLIHAAASYAVSADVLLLLRWIDLIVGSFLLFGIPIVFILMILREGELTGFKGLVGEAKKYFWKYIGQSFMGMILAFVFTLPLFFVFLLIYVFEQNILPSLAWWFIFGYLGLGSVLLGSQFLIDEKNGLFKNSMNGLRMLNGHFRFFAALYTVQTLIYVLRFSLRILLGSSITGFDLTSIPTSSLSLFTEALNAATRTPIVFVYDFAVGTFLYPLGYIVISLAYLRYKNHASLSRAVPQSAPTEN